MRARLPRRLLRAALAAAPPVAAALASPPTAAEARPSQVALFEAPRELLSGDAALRARTLQEIRDLGVGRLRIVLYWHAVAPRSDSRRIPGFNERDPDAYRWGPYARAIHEARKAGLRVLLTVSGPVPRWATSHRRDHVTRPSARRFGRFMTAVGRRFRREVDWWAIWNEPNHPRFLRPQYRGRRRPVSGRLYRRLFQAGERGLRASGNGRDRILIGETAPRGTGRVVAPITFLRQTLCLNRR